LKTHQHRRIALDLETANVLREHRERCEARAKALGIEPDLEAFAFSGAPDGSTPPTPDSGTQRYDRMWPGWGSAPRCTSCGITLRSS
jgi:hypothetical protein